MPRPQASRLLPIGEQSGCLTASSGEQRRKQTSWPGWPAGRSFVSHGMSPGTRCRSDAGGLRHPAQRLRRKPEGRPWYPNITRPCRRAVPVFTRSLCFVSAHCVLRNDRSLLHRCCTVEHIESNVATGRRNRIWSHSVIAQRWVRKLGSVPQFRHSLQRMSQSLLARVLTPPSVCKLVVNKPCRS